MAPRLLLRVVSRVPLMYTVEFQFLSKRKNIREDAVRAVVSYLVALQHGGQLLGGEWPLGWAKGVMRAYGSIPERTALRQANQLPQVDQARAELTATGLATPKVTNIGRDPEASAACTCKKNSGLILYTHFLSTESPLWCADCFRPVPLYRIPPTCGPDGYSDLVYWQRNYMACDTLQMGCRVGERFGTNQMESAESKLTQIGLNCCRSINDVTGRPCYYYLYRYRNRPADDEHRRRCPGCGGRWRLRQTWHGKFDFRCVRCHLLSNTSE